MARKNISIFPNKTLAIYKFIYAIRSFIFFSIVAIFVLCLLIGFIFGFGFSVVIFVMIGSYQYYFAAIILLFILSIIKSIYRRFLLKKVRKFITALEVSIEGEYIYRSSWFGIRSKTADPTFLLIRRNGNICVVGSATGYKRHWFNAKDILEISIVRKSYLSRDMEIRYQIDRKGPILLFVVPLGWDQEEVKTLTLIWRCLGIEIGQCRQFVDLSLSGI